ncbi:MAG: hypothetical protein HZA90_11270 [Verrucomicrobia bacterium]|nr:hypothetical protein [Verrucomicrobiota bacterium]
MAAPDRAGGFYPLGLYGVNATNDLPIVKAAGFNLVTGPAERRYLDAAAAHGLKVLTPPDTAAGPEFDPARAQEAIRRFDRHPALWAWYLIDEPDFNQVPPEQVRQAQRFVKSLRPSKPTALVLFQGAQSRYYANLADITMIDRYPVPWLPLANFGQHVQMTRLALPARKPLVAVIQAFDWSSCPELLPGEANFRPPAFEEMRCMTYEALARGANGLFYFAYDSGAWKIREHPETWAALKRVVAEINDRRPLFQAEPRWWPKLHRFADSKRRFNAALESSVTSCLLRVRRGNGVVPAGDYVLAVNNTDQTHTYSFTLPPTPGVVGKAVSTSQAVSRIGVLGEDREVPVQGGWVTDDFGPYAVRVFGPLP